MPKSLLRSIAVAFFIMNAAAFAQTFPAKTVRLIAPFAAGGALDLIARAVGQKLSDGLGRPVIVDNRAGASGAIGSELVAKSAPDGYTLLLGATTTHGINPALNPKLQYDPIKDFTPISLVATIPHVIVDADGAERVLRGIAIERTESAPRAALVDARSGALVAFAEGDRKSVV